MAEFLTDVCHTKFNVYPHPHECAYTLKTHIKAHYYIHHILLATV